MRDQKSADAPIEFFADEAAWSAWLKQNHATSAGVWLRISKKGRAVQSVSYAEALDEALCYGWIDGQKRSHDTSSWLQKFTPRGPRSVWSKVNREKAETLIREGRMKPAGLKAIEQAKANGQWDAAYDSQRGIEIPPDLQAELRKNQKAAAFFATLNSVNRYAILYRLQTARKPETRAKRLRQFIEMLEKNQKIHP